MPKKQKLYFCPSFACFFRVLDLKLDRHANAEEAEKEEFSAKFKQAKVTFEFFRID